jgi:hypothetical protein
VDPKKKILSPESYERFERTQRMLLEAIKRREQQLAERAAQTKRPKR